MNRSLLINVVLSKIKMQGHLKSVNEKTQCFKNLKLAVNLEVNAFLHLSQSSLPPIEGEQS
jgi:hypothetical protein